MCTDYVLLDVERCRRNGHALQCDHQTNRGKHTIPLMLTKFEPVTFTGKPSYFLSEVGRALASGPHGKRTSQSAWRNSSRATNCYLIPKCIPPIGVGRRRAKKDEDLTRRNGIQFVDEGMCRIKLLSVLVIRLRNWTYAPVTFSVYYVRLVSHNRSDRGITKHNTNSFDMVPAEGLEPTTS